MKAGVAHRGLHPHLWRWRAGGWATSTAKPNSARPGSGRSNRCDELLALSAVNRTLADRLLLHVGNLPAFHIDRATIRIVARHGWLDLDAEYDEWQAWFARGATDAAINLGELSYRLTQVAGEYCGPTAKCENCPLNSLLPASGPVPLDADD
ncbi:MAG: hypothetical protein EXS05_11000 [Planctomycetaceae bacterium]|nr:hypothetical protein [Planctomycetaceae bacterium]